MGREKRKSAVSARVSYLTNPYEEHDADLANRLNYGTICRQVLLTRSGVFIASNWAFEAGFVEEDENRWRDDGNDVCIIVLSIRNAGRVKDTSRCRQRA